LKSERIASFLAVLELLRLKIIRISQSHAFDPIYIFLREGGDSHGATTEGVLSWRNWRHFFSRPEIR
jgi:chromatin segregation and condensation protein Rec8/ScpA/Scc1 (kleisin family)